MLRLHGLEFFARVVSEGGALALAEAENTWERQRNGQGVHL
jgi:hypothetical protein